jgi:NAD(P)H dehydrogenase (quinone)
MAEKVGVIDPTRGPVFLVRRPASSDGAGEITITATTGRGFSMTKAKKILILGATGNLAKLVTGRLAADHPALSLRLTSHREEGRDALRKAFPNAEVVSADWCDEGSLRAAFRDISKVLFVTPDFTTDESVVTPNVIRAAKASSELSQIVRLIAIPPGFLSDALTARQRASQCGAAIHTVAKALLDDSGLPVTYVNVAAWIMFNLPWFMSTDVKSMRRLIMPSAADAARHWVCEKDVADILAKILVEPAADHVGKEYVISGERRYTFAQVAALLGEIIGTPVTYVDSDVSLRGSMGENFDRVMDYFSHETQAYSTVPETRTIEQLLGRQRVTLADYIRESRDCFA